MPEGVRKLAIAFGARPPASRAPAVAQELGAIDRGETHGGAAPQPPSAAGMLLDRWDVQSHQYSNQAEVQMSLLAGLFSSKAKTSQFGIVQEAKRYCINETDTGERVEFGTAVRLAVAVLDTAFDAKLATLPNIAATAQLGSIKARIALSVDGYVGPLGELLPAPDSLNVENLGVYTAAFKAIQALVFGAAGLNYIAPTLLGYNERENQAT
jgi:hypothetical protein